jgi:hypothetical protein
MVLGVSTAVLYMLYVGVGIGVCIGGIGCLKVSWETAMPTIARASTDVKTG